MQHLGPSPLLLSDSHLLTASSPSKRSADLSWKAHSRPFSSESSLHCSDDSLKCCLVTSHGSKRDSVFMTVGVDWILPGDPSAVFGITLRLQSPGGATRLEVARCLIHLSESA